MPIGVPKPSLSFAYKYTDSTGASSEYTNQWQSFGATASRLIVTQTAGRGVGQSTYTGVHHIANDVLFLESSRSTGTQGGVPFDSAMTYTPAAIGDPVTRACPGASWDIPSVTATSKSLQGQFSTKTDRGRLQIVAVRESVTVPAGTFSTVHYTKIMTTAGGQQRDEFWKSLEHGVTVKRTGTQPGGSSAETLIAIR